jgi:hypothetical protein
MNFRAASWVIFARFFERLDQLGNERLVHRADGVRRPFLDLVRDRPIGDGGAVGALEVLRGARMLDHLRIEARDLIHPVIQHDDVRVVVDPPEVGSAVAARVATLAIHLPVGDAVDAVGISLLFRHLHPAPQVLADVALEAVDLRLVREEDVLRRDERGPGVAGVVVGVGQPGREAVTVFRAA